MRAAFLVSALLGFASLAHETLTFSSPQRAQDGAGGRSTQAITFSKEVAAIFFEKCITCHRPSGSAPFSLLTYDEARDHAVQIAAAVERRAMPPWPPEPGHGEFVGNRRLTDAQIATIRQWVADGTLEGDPALLPPRR